MIHWQYMPYVLPLLVAAIISVAIAFYAWRHRSTPGATPLVVLMLAVVVWSLGYAMELPSPDLATKIFWSNVNFLGIVVVPMAWLAFVLQYTGREKWLTRCHLALLAVEPLIILSLVWTNDLHHLFWSDVRLDTSGPFPMLDPTFSMGVWVHVVYSYTLLSLATFSLIQTLVRSPRLYRGQVIVLLVGALVPWVGNVLHISSLSPFSHLDLTPFAFTLTSLALAWGLFRFRLLDIVPVARNAVLESMSDGMIVLDAKNRIVDLNPAAARIIDHPVSEAIGQPAASVLSGHLDLVERYHDATEAHAEIVLGADEARRHYDLCISPLHDRHGSLTGRLIVLHDVTRRKQAEERLRTRERFLECLSEVSQQLLRADDLAEELPAILRCLGETAEICRTYLFENHTGPEGELLCSQRYEWCAPGAEPQINNPELQDFSYVAAGFVRWVETLARGDVIAGAVADLPESERVVLESQSIRSILIIPLFVSDAWHGFIGFDVCDRVREWQQVEIDLLRAAASDIASGIEREQARRQAQALAEAAAALTATLDLEQVLDRILEQVGRVVSNDAANVMLIEGDQARVVRWRGYERFGSEEFVSTVIFRISEVPNLQQMVESREPMVILDTAAYPGWAQVPTQEWLRSYAAAPIVVRGEVIGFLNVDSATPGFFTQAHIVPLRAFADYAAVAIENAQLFQSEQQQTHRLAMLADVARVVATTLDVDDLLQAVTENIHRHFACPMIELFTLDDEGKTLLLRGYSGIPIGSSEAIAPRVYRQPIEQGIIGHVARTGKPYIASDVRTDPYFLCVGETSIRSELCVPILDKGRVVGAVDVESDRLADFDEGDRSLLEVVADTIAIGLRNVRLYEETQRRLQELALLNRVSVGFGVALSVDALINCALEGLQELVGADRTYFVTTDPDACVWETTHELVAPGIEPDIGLHGDFDDVSAELEALLSGQPFAVSDIATDLRVENMRETYRALGMQSMLLMPVQARGRLYGALGFDFCRERHAWQPDEIRLLEGVAHQLELALENVGLLEEACLRADELAAALAQQEELDRLKDEFIQNVSHELRSPLTLICGYAEMLNTGELGELQPDQRQPVAVITRRAHMLKHLVQDIMLILEAGVNPPEAEPVPLDELVLAAVEDFQVVTRQAGLTLQAEIAPHLPPVNGSPMYLRRVLDNLIGNAAKFTPEGGTITVRLRQEGQWVALEVSDTGIGMPADKLERIFERFYQVDGSAKRKYSGVGLGLALVKEIVETFGGSVTVESQVGEGTTFTVLFPIAAGAEETK